MRPAIPRSDPSNSRATALNSRPALAARAQRRSETQPSAAAVIPVVDQSEIRRRTSCGERDDKDQSASARAIAGRLKWRRGSTSAGTTRTTARQARHR